MKAAEAPTPSLGDFDRQTPESAIRYPLSLPSSPLKRLPKIWLGRLLGVLLPVRASRLLTEGDPMQFGFVDRLLVAGLVGRALAKGELQTLEGIQQRFWAGRGGALFNTVGDVADRFETWFLQRHAVVIEHLATEIGNGSGWRALHELGSGNGLVLRHLAQRFDGLPILHGVDLNEVATRSNRERWPDPRLHFVTAEAGAWVAAEAAPNQVWFTNAGVLEYLPEARVEALLQAIGSQGSPSVFALVEPIAATHQLTSNPHSEVKAGEFSYSHNLPQLFKRTGWQIRADEVFEHEGSRWQILVARR